MATNFPASLDTLTNPTSSDSLSSPSHSAQHANVNDAVEALQAKVGVDSSAVTSSLDYKVAQLEGRDTAGLVHISRTTVGSAVSSVTVSGAVSADYDNYQVIVSGGVSSVITGLSMYLDGLTSGYRYAYQFEFWNGTPVSKGASTSDTKWSTCGEGTPTSLKMNMMLMSPFLSKEKTITFAHSGTNVVTRGGGSNADTTSRTGFVVFPNLGTLTGGTIDVYGYAKA